MVHNINSFQNLQLTLPIYNLFGSFLVLMLKTYIKFTSAGKIFPVLNVGIASLAENWKIKTKIENTRPDEEMPILFDKMLNEIMMIIPKVNQYQ